MELDAKKYSKITFSDGTEARNPLMIDVIASMPYPFEFRKNIEHLVGVFWINEEGNPRSKTERVNDVRFI